MHLNTHYAVSLLYTISTPDLAISVSKHPHIICCGVATFDSDNIITLLYVFEMTAICAGASKLIVPLPSVNCFSNLCAVRDSR